MNCTAESVRDENLLARLDLELLDQGIVAHGDGLAELVGRHNERLVAIVERFAKLVESRKRLADFTAWANGQLDNFLAERGRLERETWDWLREVRSALAEREDVLTRAEGAIGGLMADLHQRREQIVDRLTKSMAKTRKEYLEANPYRGGAYFAELVDSDDAVVAIDKECTQLKHDVEWVADRRRRIVSDRSAVRMCQEAVFGRLLN